MSDTSKPYPYETRLDIAFAPLETIDVQKIVDATTHPWFNQTLCAVNESVVRLGIVQGEYHWHQHDDLADGLAAAIGLLGARQRAAILRRHLLADSVAVCRGHDDLVALGKGGRGERRAKQARAAKRKGG